MPPDPTLRELAEEAWDAFVSVDGKLVGSVRLLATRPGELTARYLAGHRARYIPPLRLYLACSVAFFVLEASLPNDKRTLQVRTGGVTGTRDPLSATDAAAGVTGPEYSRRVQRGLRRAAYSQQAGFAERMLDHIPQAMFVLVPLQAVLLALVYRRRRRRLPSHLVFALHTHAAGLAVLAVLGALAAVLPKFAAPWGSVVTLVAIAVYVPVSMRRVYGGRWSATVARAVAVSTVYLLAMAAALLVLTLATFYMMGAPTVER